MQRIMRVAAATLVCSASTSLPAQRTPGPLAGIDTYIERSIKEWGIAGLSVAVVKDDSVVYLRGFGVRELGKPGRVDANTVFAIGSNTKLFTAVAAGMVVDDGKLRWDEPVTTYLPDFRLSDPWVTQQVTIRDLLAHRSGLGQQRGNMIYYGSAFDRREVIRRTRYLKLTNSFRSRFAYQNLGLLAAGEVAAAAAGESWDTLVTSRILAPLGMIRTNTSVRDLRGLDNVAQPHVSNGTTLRPIPWRDIDNIGPAGSINSSAADMAKWVRLLLADGRDGGRQLITPRSLREIESPQTVIPCGPDTLRPSIHFCAYGLGVMMSDYMGVKVLSHTGGIDGMLSAVTVVPERRLGIVVLTNTDGRNGLYVAVAQQILDAFLGAPRRDWSATLLVQFREQERMIRGLEADAEARRPKVAPSSLPLARYTGVYTNQTYGDIRLDVEHEQLVARLGPTLRAQLQHWAYDTYRLVWQGDGPALGATFITFAVDGFGRVASLTIRDDVVRPASMQMWDADVFTRVEEPATVTAISASTPTVTSPGGRKP